jgi:outer membrane protein
MRLRKIFFGTFSAICLFLTPLAFSEEYALADLYRIALERAEKILLSEQNLALAEIGRDKARALLLPKLTAFDNYQQYSEAKYNDKNSLIQPHSTQQWGVRLDQQFSLSFREFTAFDMAKHNIEKSKQDVAAIKETYLLLIAQAYYNVLMAKKALDITETNVARLSTYRDAAEKRLKVGEVTKTVLLRAEGELSGARADKVKAQNGLAFTKAQLVRIVGIDADFSLKESPVQETSVLSLPELQSTAFSERSDLKSLELQNKLAEEQVSYAKGAFWPNLGIAGVYQKADQDPTSASLNHESLYAGLSLSFPFFEGGLRKSELQEAQIRQKQATLQYEDLKKTIGLEVESAYLDLLTQKEALTYLKDQLAFAEDNYRAVSRQFEVGLADSINVIDANTLLVSAERGFTEAAYMYQVAILRMKQVTGTFLKEIAE